MAGSTVFVADGASTKVYSFAADGTGIVATNNLGLAASNPMVFDGENLVCCTQTGTVTAYKLPPSPVGTETRHRDHCIVFDGRNTWIGSSFGNWMEKR